MALIVFVLTPSAFLVIYPRFGPVNTMTAFCTAEGEGEYATAYALLSKGAQQRVSLDAFTQTSHGVNLISCAPSRGIPLILGGDAGQSGCDHPNDWRRRARRVNVVCP
ncbi:MAG TPA: hypothetical protein VFQ25_01115 [Ktedonobacterales bacterium]|nr:hypothetical protein [Ktedonobacterales bacterium]